MSNKLFYTGNPNSLTPCEWLGNITGLDPELKEDNDPCLNGQCRGRINGVCPFRGDKIVSLKEKYAGFFSTKQDEVK